MQDTAVHVKIFRQFTFILSGLAVLLAGLPFLIGLIGGSPGTHYLGIQYNTDDHMVYRAWMEQARHGRFTFENLFAVDTQSGLLLHLYFLVLGWISIPLGPVLAFTLARLLFTFLSVHALGELLLRVNLDVYTRKLALAFAVSGGGIGFLVWHQFGVVITRSAPPVLGELLLGRLPVDVWQPETMFFSSMLTNGLFMVSLFLILVTLVCVLDARENKRAALWGALSFGLLMNIHSYDALLVLLILLPFLGSTFARGTFTTPWFGRALLIGAGAIPAALWFLYVLRVDPVFQARAATLTYSSNFRTILGGILPCLLLAIAALTEWGAKNKSYLLAGSAGFLLVPIGLSVAASGHLEDGYFMGLAAFAGVYVIVLATNALLATEDIGKNLIFAWASTSIVAPYFPALFQRKLGMMMLLPWGILAAIGLGVLLKKQERNVRNLVTTLFILCFGATSLQWLVREISFIRLNVSNTTVHPVYVSPEVPLIAKALQGDKSVRFVAPPGRASAGYDEASQAQLPDQFNTPILPDLNPVLVAMAGVKGYASHWSETPDYKRRRSEIEMFYFADSMPNSARAEWLATKGITHFVVVHPGAIPGLNLPDLSSLGTKVIEGSQFQLYRVK